MKKKLNLPTKIALFKKESQPNSKQKKSESWVRSSEFLQISGKCLNNSDIL